MKKLVLFLALVATLVMLASCGKKYESKDVPLDGTSLSTYSAMVDNTECMGLKAADGTPITEPEFSSCEVDKGVVKAVYSGEMYQCALYDLDGSMLLKKGFVHFVPRDGGLSYYMMSEVPEKESDKKSDDYLYFPSLHKKVGPVRGTVVNVDSCFIEYRVDNLYGLLTFEGVEVFDELAKRVYFSPDFVFAQCGNTYKKYDTRGKFLGTKLSQSDINFIKEAHERANSWKKK